MADVQAKRDKFDEFWSGDHILVHLDARHDDVRVPEHLGGESALTLKLSAFFQGEITHDEQQIVAYLKFGGAYEKCVIPWEAVWGMTSDKQEQVIWPEDLPREVVLKIAREQFAALGDKIFKRRRPASQDDNASPAPKPVASTAPEESTEPENKKRGHLRLIK
ncbi:MAG: hypothetical protein KDD44_04415 [Bdellovibrionales bacterium]|nr:hypothetical protein [Bdellovibrionales bacterium]